MVIPQAIFRFPQEDRALRVVDTRTHYRDLFVCMCDILYGDVEKAPDQLRNVIKESIIDDRKDVVSMLLSLFEAGESFGIGSGNKTLQDDQQTLDDLRTKLQKDILLMPYDVQHIDVYLHCFAMFFKVDIFVASPSPTPAWRYYPSINLTLNRQFRVDSKEMQDRDGNRLGSEKIRLIMLYRIGRCGNTFFRIDSSGNVEVPRIHGLLDVYARKLKDCYPSDLEIRSSFLRLFKSNVARWFEDVLKKIGPIFREELVRNDETYMPEPGLFQEKGRPDISVLLDLVERQSDSIPRKVLYQVLVNELHLPVLEYLNRNKDLEKEILFIKQYRAIRSLEATIWRFHDLMKQFNDKHEELKERRLTMNKAVIGTSVTGILGGAMGIAGLVLIPFTAGRLSLGLTLAGGVVGVGSGAVQGGFRINEIVKQDQTIQQMKLDLETVLRYVNYSYFRDTSTFVRQLETSTIIRQFDDPGGALQSGMSVGSILRSVYSIIGVAIAAARVGTKAAVAAAFILGPVGLLFDIGFLAEAAYNTKQGGKTEAGQMVECFVAFQKIFISHYCGNSDNDAELVDQILRE